MVVERRSCKLVVETDKVGYLVDCEGPAQNPNR